MLVNENVVIPRYTSILKIIKCTTKIPIKVLPLFYLLRYRKYKFIYILIYYIVSKSNSMKKENGKTFCYISLRFKEKI